MDNLSEFAYSCVLNYSTYNTFSRQHDLKLSDLPDTVIHEFSSLCLSNEMWASESTGGDNKSFSLKMLTSLQTLLKNTYNKESRDDFCDKWIDGVSLYFKDNLSKLIKKELAEYNDSLGLSISNEMYAHEVGSRLTYQGGA